VGRRLMGTRQLKYAQIVEKELAEGTPFSEAHKIANEKSQIKRRVEVEKPKESLISKTKKRLAKVFGKKKIVKPTASEKKIIKKQLKKKYPQMSQPGWGKPKKLTERTKQVSGQLSKSLTKEEIAKFRKK
jgi:hypothetical protein